LTTNTDLTSETFKAAVIDYYYFLEKNYPEKETVKLVGDRYRLTGPQRTILFRGITAQEKALKRRARLISIEDAKEKKWYIDGYNVLFSLMNYLLGKKIFIGNDCILRDSGEAYGKIENETVFFRSAHLMVDFIVKSNSAEAVIYLDRPVSNSHSHIEAIEKKIKHEQANARVCLVPAVDNQLIQKEDGVIATSDSEIIDKTSCKILDLARCLLEITYGINIFDLRDLMV
jgi:hypothetical protein